MSNDLQLTGRRMETDSPQALRNDWEAHLAWPNPTPLRSGMRRGLAVNSRNLGWVMLVGGLPMAVDAALKAVLKRRECGFSVNSRYAG